MGSVVLGDLVSAGPYLATYTTMLATDAHPEQLRPTPSVYRSSSAPHSDLHSPYRSMPADDANVARTASRPPKVVVRSSNVSHNATQAALSSSTSQQQQQQHPPVTDPIPVPRARSNSQPVHNDPSSSDSAETLRAVPPDPLIAVNSAAQVTPPYDSTVAHSSLLQHMPDFPSVVKLRDLAHLEHLAREDLLRGSSGIRSRSSADVDDDVGIKYDISAMPVTDIIEMVAGLLTKITTTNDRQHEHLHQYLPPAEGSVGLTPQTSSVLSFHGKNVPTITISSYLTRIHRYCPTTYEVFLGLLVYFDRMTERVGFGSSPNQRRPSRSTESRSVSEIRTKEGGGGGERGEREGRSSTGSDQEGNSSLVTPPSSVSVEPHDRPSNPASPRLRSEPASTTAVRAYPTAQFFVVDSYNIHRLIIAGVTCASKFFSDVFYTNSRYAKVSSSRSYPYFYDIYSCYFTYCSPFPH